METKRMKGCHEIAWKVTLLDIKNGLSQTFYKYQLDILLIYSLLTALPFTKVFPKIDFFSGNVDSFCRGTDREYKVWW